MAAYEGYPKKATKSWPKHENNLNEDVSGANCTRINIGSSGEIQEIHNSSSNLVKSVVLNLENPELGYPLDVTENKKPFSHKDTVVTISLSSYKNAPTKDSVCSFTLENEVFLNDSVKNDLSKFAANTESSPKVYSSSDEYSEKDFKNGDYCKMEKLYSPMVHVPGDSLKNDMPCQMPGTWNDVSAEDFSGEDFHCYLICYACCHRRILKKVAPLTVNSPKVMAISHMERARLLEYDPPEGRRLFFDDGIRRIDFILAWKAKKRNLDDTKNTDSAQEIQVNSEDQKEDQNLSRVIFEQNLRTEGLNIEHDIQCSQRIGIGKAIVFTGFICLWDI
ncbi:hypothetical protein LSH36_569g01006 [Paralvinella palmiformis]|uniref:Anoctamin dimerisation domain-containing protein n=1 Tax=Paralvinella palmiformis TaxID=53620 RepID=A0AAD9MVM9_9ANNE|nr:hypothetical protein LSH36_569g01006 [Paralvinella palmiformis]